VKPSKYAASGALDVSSYTNTWGTDHASAETKNGAMSFEQMNGFINEIIVQPPWRGRADVEADYYDSNQYDAETLQEMKTRGIPPIVVNLIAPTINMVLGLEAKTRTDWVVKPELDQYEDAALAMSQKLKEAERMSGADRANADAYDNQIKVGLGWVEVGYNKQDPFGYRYSCQFVHRREIWWDWHDNDPGLAKARYLVRRKWYDEDVACAYFPQHEALIKGALRGWSNFDPSQLDTAAPLYIDLDHERNFAWQEEEWRDSLRKRICIYEVWYRTYSRGFIVRFKNGQVKEFDDQNPVQLAAVNAGMANIEAVVIPKMRMSYWVGPHRLADMETPYPHQEFPYVPFWGFREDRTGTPYGMIRAMKPLQDEVNARRAKMLWQLSARRVFVDEDAVADHDKFKDEVARPDMYASVNTMKGKYKVTDRIHIEDNTGLTAQQFDVYQDSKQSLQDAAGVYASQLGKKDGSADSGIAISQLIEQGTTTLAKINDNYGVARMLVGNRLLALISFDMAGKEESVKVQQFGAYKRVKFNQKKTDPVTNRTYLNNDITRMQMSVVLADLPQTPTYRMQQFMELTKMVATLPEQVQMAVIDIVINASDIPDKQEILKRLRDTLGIGSKPQEDMDEEELAEFQAKQQEAQRQKQIQQRIEAATAAELESKVPLNDAKTELTLVQADAIKVESSLAPELSRHASTAQAVEEQEQAAELANQPPPVQQQPQQIEG
jgi:hypothetical protein